MVRTKGRANIAISCYPGPYSSISYENEPVLRWVKRLAPLGLFLNSGLRLFLIDRSLANPDGMWTDGPVYFINKAAAILNTFYYRDLSHAYSQYQPDSHSRPYNESEFNRKFANSPLNNDPYPLKESFAGLDPQEMDKRSKLPSI